MSRTLILVKPDAFERALTGEVLARFERKGLRIAALKKMRADANLANEHYAEHSEKPFFGELVSFMISGPVVVQVLEAGARERFKGQCPMGWAPEFAFTYAEQLKAWLASGRPGVAHPR